MKDDVSVSKGGSLRFNKGKPAMSHLDHKFLLGMAEVMTASNEKYPKYNWSKSQEITTAYDSCMRHVFAFMDGESNDLDTKKHHLFHAACNLMIMWYTEQNHPESDDRYFIKENKDDRQEEN